VLEFDSKLIGHNGFFQQKMEGDEGEDGTPSGLLSSSELLDKNEVMITLRHLRYNVS